MNTLNYGSKKKDALVVDDDPHVRDFIREVLEEMNFNVFTAGDGLAAEAILNMQPGIVLIVTDIIMPEEEGILFIRNVRRRVNFNDVAPRILAISGSSRYVADYLEDAKILGADKTLSKPFTDSDLKAAVQSLNP
jgi:CheY-like chemotaxis protein